MVKNTLGKLNNFIKDNGLLDEVHKVYVATSGGADSMALLSFMHTNRNRFGIEVGAVHVNHGIRGELANRDAEFVRAYCSGHCIEYVLFDANTDSSVIIPNNPTEDWARELRYHYFEKLMGKGIKIATAHTSSDQTETILFRMARGGSGLRGLSGIPIQRDNYIRPFLCINRTEVEELVKFFKTGNITDETNLGDDYTRNRIRHYIVPELKKINENVEESFSKLSARAAKAQAYIEKCAKMKLCACEKIEGYIYQTAGFIGEDEIIQEEMITQLLTKGKDIRVREQAIFEIEKHIHQVGVEGDKLERVIGTVNINAFTKVVVSTKYITVQNSATTLDKPVARGFNRFGSHGYNFRVEMLTYGEFSQLCTHSSMLREFADASALDIGNCTIRSRKYGDTFKTSSGTEEKVSKLLKKVPIAERDNVPVVEKGGEVVWLWGSGVSSIYTPNENSNRIYWFRSE